MKILFCPAHYSFDEGSRGSEISWAYQIVDGVSGSNSDSVVVTGFKNLKSVKKYPIIELQKNKHIIDMGLKNSLIFNFLYSKTSYLFERKSDFDIVHHVLPFGLNRTFDIFKILFKQKRAKYVIGPIQQPIPYYDDNIHDTDAKPQQGFINRIAFIFDFALSFLSISTLKKADLVIVIDEFTKKQLIDSGINKNRISVISPGINQEGFERRKRSNSKKIRLLSVGSLISRKGFDMLIKALALSREKNKNIELTIVGDGPQKEALKQLASKLKVSNHVKFVGHVNHDKMSKYYSDADVFVTMSKHESWGQMYLEAMASGLPIISSMNHGSNLIIRDTFGILLQKNTPKVCYEAIIRLINNPKKIEKMGKYSRREVINNYDWNTKIIPKYLSVYKSLLKRN